MHADTTGRVWLVFSSGQLGEVVAGMLKMHDAGRGFEPSLVHAIHEDRDRVILFARTDGLARYADGRFVTLTRDKGFPLRNLTGVVEDQRDNFWIGSNLGIARISRAEMDKAFAAGRAETIQYTLFDRSDGIASTPGRYTASADPPQWRATDASGSSPAPASPS